MPAILNGRLPDTLLAAIPWAPTKRVTHATLVDLAAMNTAFRAEFGRDLPVNEGYRDYATQVDYKARTKLPTWDPRYLASAATPGTSVHGLGEAIDFGRLGGFDSEEYAWLAANAARFGFYQPAQYREGGSHPEFWHWEHPSDTPVTQHAAPAAEEDDMPYSPEELKDLMRTVRDEKGGDTHSALVKLGRLDPQVVLFRTADGRRGVAWPGRGYAIAPDDETAQGFIDVLSKTGRPPESLAVATWLGVGGSDVVSNPEKFGPRIPWDRHDPTA